MCGIVAAIGAVERDAHHVQAAIRLTSARGADFHGVWSDGRVGFGPGRPTDDLHVGRGPLLFNARAVPTTEWNAGPRPEDQQPFQDDKWVVTHNGVIANDRELRERWQLPVTSPVDSAVLPHLFSRLGFVDGLDAVVGSYAIAALHKATGDLLTASNYRPLHVALAPDRATAIVSSDVHALPSGWIVRALGPYRRARLRVDQGAVVLAADHEVARDAGRGVLVVASSGLDSTVAAAQCMARGDDVTLLHFRYGCRAQDRELQAVQAIARELGVQLIVQDMGDVFRQIGGSALTTDREVDVADGGENSAHVGSEWVPARNLVMLSTAIAIAEGRGLGSVVLGANMEEAGSHPDNELEFIRLRDLTAEDAVGAHRRVRVEAPVGRLCKPGIVRLGVEIGAPLHLTWSCYEGGDRHCGRCGPCFMRRRAFEIAGYVDPAFGGPWPPKTGDHA